MYSVLNKDSSMAENKVEWGFSVLSTIAYYSLGISVLILIRAQVTGNSLPRQLSTDFGVN